MPELDSPSVSTATPSSTTESAPSSSATPSTASSGSSTALQAIEKAYAAQDSPRSPSGVQADPSTGAATGAPDASGTTPSPSGEAPEPRITAAVRNAREKVEQELGWARAYGTKDDVDWAMQRVNYMKANPRAFVQQLASELGLTIGEAPVAAPKTIEDLSDPEPDLRAEDGTLAYSNKAIARLMANAGERLRREMKEQMQPALEYAEQGRQQAEQAQLSAQAKDFATRALGEVKKLAHFDQESVNREYLALSPAQRQEMGAYGALMTAYTNHITKNVLPTLSTTARTETIEDLRRSAVAGSTTAASATPASASHKVNIKDGDLNALAARMEYHYGKQSAT